MNTHEQHIQAHKEALKIPDDPKAYARVKVNKYQAVRLAMNSFFNGTSYLDEKKKYVDQQNRDWWASLDKHMQNHIDFVNSIAGLNSMAKGEKS